MIFGGMALDGEGFGVVWGEKRVRGNDKRETPGRFQASPQSMSVARETSDAPPDSD
jgi:hypothetical protein